ncbi:MAG: S41 family peptidase [Chitinophagaceae bacterium]
MSIQKKKLQIWLPLLFSLVMILGIMIGYKLRENIRTAKSFFHIDKRSPLQQVIDLIALKYVDPVNTDTLANEAIEQILSRLDPHSVYIPPLELEEVNEDLQGNFQGIGVEFHIFQDTVNVINVLPKGPSDKAGLLTGDQFLKVEDSMVAGRKMTPEKIKKMLRGPGASEVRVTMLRGKKQVDFTISRGRIPLPSIDAAYMINRQTGLIRINKFSQTTYKEFMEAMEGLQSKGLKKLILDLRGNGGGILNEAVEIADEFLSNDKLIVYTQGNKSAKEEYRCKRPGLFEEGPLILITDEGSASASEVLAGALQDWDRATIIGRRTFGKGLVQEQYDLADGSALRLTVARYYTPSGRSIQKSYKGKGDYRQEILDRYNHGEFVNADSNKIQHGKAYKTKSGRTVYSGGGIMPDIFVPFDTSSYSPTLTALNISATLTNFIYSYYIQHKEQFKTYRSAIDFATHFKQDEATWTELVSYAAKDSIYLSKLPVSEKIVVQRRMKALLARQPWRSEGFYQVLNLDDSVIKRALDNVEK